MNNLKPATYSTACYVNTFNMPQPKLASHYPSGCGWNHSQLWQCGAFSLSLYPP